MRPLRVLSLGAGVQSSTLSLMMAKGEIEPADHAVFADTQAEPQPVYEYLDYIIPLLPFPVHIVTAGNIEKDFMAALRNPKGRCSQPPFMVKNRQTGKSGRLWRKCTRDYKLIPIRQQIRKLIKKGQTVEQIIGISLDEAHRMKASDVKYITNVYPLVDKKLNRNDCMNWIKRHLYKMPPKSACRICPYIDNHRLRYMKYSNRSDYDRLVSFDKGIRIAQQQTINGAKITGEIYVHRECKPIDEIDLSTAEDHGQVDMFGEECEGMCGL